MGNLIAQVVLEGFNWLQLPLLAGFVAREKSLERGFSRLFRVRRAAYTGLFRKPVADRARFGMRITARLSGDQGVEILSRDTEVMNRLIESIADPTDRLSIEAYLAACHRCLEHHKLQNQFSQVVN